MAFLLILRSCRIQLYLNFLYLCMGASGDFFVVVHWGVDDLQVFIAFGLLAITGEGLPCAVADAVGGGRAG